MDKSPYALDFLLHQLQTVIRNIRKPSYREEVNRMVDNHDWFETFKIAKDSKSRNYRHGILERTSAVGSLAMCFYDNYPLFDIDLILSGVVISGFRDAVGRKQVYDLLKNDELKQIVYKKSRKKPRVEFFLFDELFKIDNKLIFMLHTQTKNG